MLGIAVSTPELGGDVVATPLGEYLVQRRRQLGMDRKTLAALSGLSYPYVSQLEASEDKRPSEKALRLLAPALQVELGELLEVADGWTSGTLSTPPDLRRSTWSRPATPHAHPDLSNSVPGESFDAVLGHVRARRSNRRSELVDDLARQLQHLPPADQLAVLHDLQARALEQLTQQV